MRSRNFRSEIPYNSDVKLIQAIRSRQPDLERLFSLIANDADINQRDQYGYDALFYSIVGNKGDDLTNALIANSSECAIRQTYKISSKEA